MRQFRFITKMLYTISFVCVFILGGAAQSKAEQFLTYHIHPVSHKVSLVVPHDWINQECLMVISLSSGLGSNDIGLDRGKLMETHLVTFEQWGNKILLIAQNTKYRALSNQPKEKKAVTDAFATSVLYTFRIDSSTHTHHFLDAGDFLLTDYMFIPDILKKAEQGTYKLDKARSAFKPSEILNFPKNIYAEALLTFSADQSGSLIESVAALGQIFTIKQHIQFVQLPDEAYTPRPFDPNAGYFYTSFFDYATPFYQPIEQRYLHRHRLKKKNPSLAVSEVEEPIVYYIDPGCPEPVKSALIEGGMWWSDAFEKAGYKNAFFIKELPEGAHMLDVRYNVIQWVHRSTRGWSYGASIVDPRTGEIIKGQVSLGSLRVRQDYLLGLGMHPSFAQLNAQNDSTVQQFALSRLKQLSAHEIGHTLGLAHNYIASSQGRSSVMDYPHPKYSIKDNVISLDDAYAEGIGEWDIRAIRHGYAYTVDDEALSLNQELMATASMGLRFLTDQDARPMGSLSPYTHLWDNGRDPVAELDNLLTIRAHALRSFGQNNLPFGLPHSELEKILVPVYYMHRYQVEAAVKYIGGLDFDYSVKRDSTITSVVPIDKALQKKALQAIIKSLQKEVLTLDPSLTQQLTPMAYGYPKNRESFPSSAGPIFDQEMSARAMIDFTMQLLLHHERLQRLAASEDYSLESYYGDLVDLVFTDDEDNIAFLSKISLAIKLKNISESSLYTDIVRYHTQQLISNILRRNTKSKNKMLSRQMAYIYTLLENRYSHTHQNLKMAALPSLPPGAPIGGCSLME